MNNLIINIQHKNYGLNTILKDIDISINKCGIYGIFGKNGAGKTTFFNCIIGLTPFQGEILINDNVRKPNDIAYIPTHPEMYEYLTGKEFNQFFQLNVLGKISSTKPFYEIDENKLIKNYSTGTRKKAYINAVLQSQDYKLYIFDEPFNGLDIEATYQLLDKIKQLAENNIVLISSHILEIILPYTTANYVIYNNRLIECSTQEEIKNSLLKA